jgi:hypothetical protein
MISGEKEISTMISDGKTYFSSIVDLTTSNELKLIKSKCSELIKNFCTKFDGFSNFISNYILVLFSFIMNKSQINENIDYEVLKINSSIYNSFTFEMILELCLTVLVTLSVYVKKSHIGLLQYLFRKHMEALLNQNESILICRLILFLGFYVDKIYDITKPEDETMFKNLVQYLLTYLFIYDKNQAISYEAANAIKDLVYFREYNDIIQICFHEKITFFIKDIKETDNVIFFEILVEMLTYFDFDLNYFDIMSNLVKRILWEYKNNKSKKRLSPIINKAFGCITVLSEKEEFIMNNYVTKNIFKN